MSCELAKSATGGAFDRVVTPSEIRVHCSLSTVNSQQSTVNSQHHSGVTGNDINLTKNVELLHLVWLLAANPRAREFA